jgi:beta-lactamase regulating signal transducer with metallopeptidase domain
MEWSHFVVWLLGYFIGSLLMTVWRNERRYRREQDALRLGAMNRRR